MVERLNQETGQFLPAHCVCHQLNWLHNIHLSIREIWGLFVEDKPGVTKYSEVSRKLMIRNKQSMWCTTQHLNLPLLKRRLGEGQVRAGPAEERLEVCTSPFMGQVGQEANLYLGSLQLRHNLACRLHFPSIDENGAKLR